VRFRWETEFKETEIGTLPKDWNPVTLSKCVSCQKCSIDPRYSPNELFLLYSIPGYDAGKVPERTYGKDIGSSKILIETGQILFSKLNPRFPRIWKVRETNSLRKIASTEFLPLTPRRGVLDANYLEKVLSSNFFISQISETVTGTTGSRERLKQDVILGTLIPCPPMFLEQQRIATTLSWFDELIENKKRQNEVLEKTAMAIFKSWFVDFAPFQYGKFIPSEFGEVPKEYDVKSLEEVATLYKGVSYSSSDISLEPHGNLFITLNNFLREGGFKLEYDYYVGSKAKEEHKVKEGDLIIALTDMTPLAKVVGSPAIVSLPYGHDFGVISLDCGKLQPHKECLRFYLYLYLKHTQEENSTFANGVNVLHLNTNLFMRNKLVLIPPEPILEKFHSLVGPLFKKIAINQKQILILRGIRDTLLPLLIFGRLRVEEI
jgi:type I restriction enzyme S subunit